MDKAGQILLIDAFSVEAAPTPGDLNGPNFRRWYRLGYRRRHADLGAACGLRIRYLPSHSALLTRI